MIVLLKIKDFIWLLFKSKSLRLKLSLLGGMIINTLYIAGNLATAFLYRNIWSATLTIYHSIFLIIRFYIISSSRKTLSNIESRQVCFRVGIFLLFFDLAAMAIMVYTIRMSRPTEYSGVVLLGFLIYTVYSLTFSVLGIKKHSNDNQPLHFAAKNMTFSAAMMSVFNLQYSVLVSFGASSYVIDRIIALGGFCVFFVIISLAIRLVINNAKGGSKICRISYTAYSGKGKKPSRKTDKEK